MKNRRLIIVAFLVVAMLVTGVGYAALTGHLTVKGTATFNLDLAEDAFVQNLVFSDPTVTHSGSAAGSQLIDVAEIGDSEQIATFKVKTLAAQNEYCVFEYTLTNNGTVDAILTIKALHDDGVTANPTQFSHYDVDVTIDNVAYLIKDDVQGSATFTLNHEEGQNSVTVIVTVTMNETPSASFVADETFALHIVATSADATP